MSVILRATEMWKGGRSFERFLQTRRKVVDRLGLIGTELDFDGRYISESEGLKHHNLLFFCIMLNFKENFKIILAV
jgi:hypothetical protein